MIRLTRLNGKQFMLNCEMIKYLESTPDTVITLIGGEKFMVLENVEEIVTMTVSYRQRLFQNPLLNINHKGIE